MRWSSHWRLICAEEPISSPTNNDTTISTDIHHLTGINPETTCLCSNRGEKPSITGPCMERSGARLSAFTPRPWRRSRLKKRCTEAVQTLTSCRKRTGRDYAQSSLDWAAGSRKCGEDCPLDRLRASSLPLRIHLQAQSRIPASRISLAALHAQAKQHHSLPVIYGSHRYFSHLPPFP